MSLHHAFMIAAVLGMPAAALAQSDRGASVSGAVSATVFESETDLSFSGAFGYRFSRVVGFEIEATVTPELSSPYPDGDYTILRASFPSIAIFPPPRLENASGRMVILSNNVRIAVPTSSRQLEPYFVAGGGIASVRQSAVLVYPLFDPRALTSELAALGLLLPGSISVPFRQPYTTSAVEMALTIGGGVSVRMLSDMAVDVDLRMFRLLGEDDRSVGRFGVGVRYRF
jgi:opacity protein-like surface antigen